MSARTAPPIPAPGPGPGPDRVATPLDPLTRLAIRHGTDKYGAHRYTPIYHRLLADWRDRPLRLLEIGVGGYDMPLIGGLGLRMWAEYFPLARIVGLDVAPKRLDPHPRITLVEGSQADPALLRALSTREGPFDVVIDDGSHRAGDVLASLRVLFPLQPPGALYVVEDLQTAFWPGYGGAETAAGTVVAEMDAMVRALHRAEIAATPDRPADRPVPPTAYDGLLAEVRLHRNLLVLFRGDDRFPSNHAFDWTGPEVRATYRSIVEEGVRAPGPGPALARVEMLRVAGRKPQALQVARAALRDHPGSLDLLYQAAWIAKDLGLADVRTRMLRRMQALRPGDPAPAALLSPAGPPPTGAPADAPMDGPAAARPGAPHSLNGPPPSQMRGAADTRDDGPRPPTPPEPRTEDPPP